MPAARPMKPPSNAPAIPISIVTMMPPGSRPGITSLASAPTIKPNTIHPITCITSPPARHTDLALRAVADPRAELALARPEGGPESDRRHHGRVGHLHQALPRYRLGAPGEYGCGPTFCARSPFMRFRCRTDVIC